MANQVIPPSLHLQSLSTLQWSTAWSPGRGGAGVWRINNHGANGPHDHVFHEIVFVEAGAAEHHTAADMRMLRPGDIIIIRPLAWHSYQNPRNLTLINCLIERRLMNQLMLLMRDETTAFDLFTRPLKHPRETPPLVLHALPTESQAARELLETIMREQQGRATAWEAMATGSLLKFLALIVRLNSRGEAPETIHLPGRAQKAVFDTVMRIEQNSRSQDALAQLAEKVHLSPGHLSRNFSRRMGMGIAEYRNRIRIEEACRLLTQTDMKLVEVAERVGYTDLTYFARRFHAMLGRTPGQYRRQATPR